MFRRAATLIAALALTPALAEEPPLKTAVDATFAPHAMPTLGGDLEPELGWKVESFGTNADAIQAVIAGRSFASVAGNTAEAWAVKNNPQIKLSFLYSTGLVWSVPLRKDQVELRNRIEDAIECM